MKKPEDYRAEFALEMAKRVAAATMPEGLDVDRMMAELLDGMVARVQSETVEHILHMLGFGTTGMTRDEAALYSRKVDEIRALLRRTP